jgi:hypothetical protein
METTIGEQNRRGRRMVVEDLDTIADTTLRGLAGQPTPPMMTLIELDEKLKEAGYYGRWPMRLLRQFMEEPGRFSSHDRDLIYRCAAAEFIETIEELDSFSLTEQDVPDLIRQGYAFENEAQAICELDRTVMSIHSELKSRRQEQEPFAWFEHPRFSELQDRASRLLSLMKENGNLAPPIRNPDGP